MCKALLFLVLVVVASASTVTLRNESAAPQVMQARGLAVVVAMEVPAGASVEVDVGEGFFDLTHFCYAFCAGFTAMAPFVAWGMVRKMFQEAA